MDKKRLLIVIVIVAAIAAFFVFDLKQYFDRELFLANKAAIDAYRAAHPWSAAAIYVAIYIGVTALSLPGAAVMTLAGGAVFGLLMGTLLVSFASAIGATLAFLASRLVLRDWVQRRFGDRLAAINAGIEREGAFYLFALRLVPLFPFFVINLVMGLTTLRTWTFYWVSQLGMLPGTIVYVYAGTQLGEFRLSAGLVIALVALGIFPLVAKRVLDAIKAHRVYRPWAHLKPAQFEYNTVVIGAGSAGLVCAYIAAATKAKVALIEKHRMGGDCLNTGCVPSKALIKSARLASQLARADEFGIEARGRVDFAAVMERVQHIVKAIEPHDSVERYTALGVDCVIGSATITSPWTVDVVTETGKRTLTTKSIIIAAGARPFVPPIPGLAGAEPLTSDNVWELRELPRRLVVLGGGPIGCELTQAFSRLGSAVTQVEMAPRLLIREDADVSRLVAERLRREGIDVRLEHKAVRFENDSGTRRLVAEHNGEHVTIEFDRVLVAVGRVANTTGYGLEELGIATTRQRTVETDDYLQTIFPNILACGDVAGPYQFTHTAAHQAWFASVNALFGSLRRFKADYRVIPWSTFTDPEVARVGLNEQEAQEKNIGHQVTTYGLDELDRAITDGEAHGFVKVLTKPGTDKVLGVTIVGDHAGDLIAEYVLAMKHGLGLNKILGTIHIYPTLAEANKYAAGAWKRSTVTRGQWAFLASFQAWRRGAGSLASVLAALIRIGNDKRAAYPHDAGPAATSAAAGAP